MSAYCTAVAMTVDGCIMHCSTPVIRSFLGCKLLSAAGVRLYSAIAIKYSVINILCCRVNALKYFRIPVMVME